jgi:hypothetical protein
VQRRRKNSSLDFNTDKTKETVLLAILMLINAYTMNKNKGVRTFPVQKEKRNVIY